MLAPLDPGTSNQQLPITKREDIRTSFEIHLEPLVMSGQNPNDPPKAILASNGNGTEPTSLPIDETPTGYMLGGIAIIIIIVYLIIKKRR